MSEIVKYDNTINSLKFNNFTKLDMDFFFACISKVYGKGTNQVSMTFEEIKELVSYTSTDRKDFIFDIERMYDKLDSILYRYEDDEVILKFHLFQKFKCLKTRDEVQIRVAEEFVPLLNDLEKNFTFFELEQFVSLESKHTKRLFNILKQWKNNGCTTSYTEEKLKELFDCKTMRLKDFTSRVVRPSVQELNEKGYFTNLEFIAERNEKKRGRPLKGTYSFTFDNQGKTYTSQQKEIMDSKAKPKKKNQFNDFEQRNRSKSDFTSLEKQLLKNSNLDNYECDGQMEIEELQGRKGESL